MSRRSAADLAIVPIPKDARVPPPPGLSTAEQKLWRSVVDSKPADWFKADSLPLLTEYVRAVSMCDALDLQIRAEMASDEATDRSVDKLLLMRDRESRRAMTLAVKMRLTQQSRYTPQASATADRKATRERPWEASA